MLPVGMSEGALGTLKGSPYDLFHNAVIGPLIETSNEMSRLFPDSIMFGSLLLYIITQNVSFGVLTFFFLETSLLHRLVAFVYEKAYGKQPLISGKTDAQIIKCRSGFKAPRKEFERTFSGDRYPSTSVFFWGSLVSYIAGSNYSFAQVLTKMNQQWWPRTSFAVIGIVFLTILFMLGRIAGCDSMSELILALVTGIIAGILLYVININLFGLEGVNFNGLPIVINKTDQGSNIYVCAPSLSG
jgi:hypothetical protein